LDFCHKYGFNESDPRSLSGFIRKLEEKKQTDAQQEQAKKAIHMYYGLVRSDPEKNKTGLIKSPLKSEGVNEAQYSYRATFSRSKLQTDTGRRDSAQDRATQTEVKGNRESAYRQLSNEIKVTHYSLKILQSFTTWVRKMQYFTQGKYRTLLSTADVKDFLRRASPRKMPKARLIFDGKGQ